MGPPYQGQAGDFQRPFCLWGLGNCSQISSGAGMGGAGPAHRSLPARSEPAKPRCCPARAIRRSPQVQLPWAPEAAAVNRPLGHLGFLCGDRWSPLHTSPRRPQAG